MSTVLCLALRTFFFFFLALSASLYIPFSSTLLVYITVLFAFTILHSLPRPLAFLCAPHVITRVVDSMSGRVLADEMEV
jgi:hypothetical protein